MKLLKFEVFVTVEDDEDVSDMADGMMETIDVCINVGQVESVYLVSEDV